MSSKNLFSFIKELNKLNHEDLFARFGDVTVQTVEENRYAFSFEFAEILWTFKEIIQFKTQIPESEKEIVLKKVISDLIIKKKYDYDSFCENLNQEISTYKTKRNKIFICSTSISVSPISIKLNNCLGCETIIFGKSYLNLSIKNERAEYKINEKEQSTKVSITVKCYDQQIALEKAKTALEILKCFLNFQYNPNTELDYLKFYDRQLPINQIVTNSHFLISEQVESKVYNSTISKTFKYSSNSINLNSFGLNQKNVLKNLKAFVKKIEKCKPKHKEDVVEAIKLFVKALDETDPLLAFLGGWTSLELLTGTHENEKVVSRLLAFYNEISRKKVFLILVSLKEYRNKFVHEGLRANDAITATLIIQDIFLRHLIYVHLRKPGTFNNMEEINYFIDNLNLDVKTINKRIESFQAIKKIRKTS